MMGCELGMEISSQTTARGATDIGTSGRISGILMGRDKEGTKLSGWQRQKVTSTDHTPQVQQHTDCLSTSTAPLSALPQHSSMDLVLPYPLSPWVPDSLSGPTGYSLQTLAE